MKTKAETITREIEIWARPPYSFEGGDGAPFIYTVGRPWHETEVMVCKATVTVDIPAGIDLLGAAIDTLRAKQDELRAKAEMEVNKIQQQINELLMLGHEKEAVDHDPHLCPHGLKLNEYCKDCDDIPF